MIRTIIDFPEGLTRYTKFDLELNVRGRSSGDSVTGAGQVVYGVSPQWELDCEILLSDKDAVLAWRSFRAQMRGRVNVTRMHVHDPLSPTLAELGLPASDIGYDDTGVPHSDGTFFDTGTGYTVDAALSISTGLPAGDTSLTIDATPINDALMPGHTFSINEWLYRVASISGTPTSRTYNFEPPLREAISVSDLLKLDAVTQMAFEIDMTAAPKMERVIFSKIPLRLVENVNR